MYASQYLWSEIGYPERCLLCTPGFRQKTPGAMATYMRYIKNSRIHKIPPGGAAHVDDRTVTAAVQSLLNEQSLSSRCHAPFTQSIEPTLVSQMSWWCVPHPVISGSTPLIPVPLGVGLWSHWAGCHRNSKTQVPRSIMHCRHKVCLSEWQQSSWRWTCTRTN